MIFCSFHSLNHVVFLHNQQLSLPFNCHESVNWKERERVNERERRRKRVREKGRKQRERERDSERKGEKE